jgi:hypothetical protein
MTGGFFNCKWQLPVFGPSTIFLKSKMVYCFSSLTHKHENWDNKNGRQTQRKIFEPIILSRQSRVVVIFCEMPFANLSSCAQILV